MSLAVEPKTSYFARIACLAAGWIAWLVAGAYTFHLPLLLGERGGALSAFEAASPLIKACVLGWIVGSVVLLAALLLFIQKASTVNRRAEKAGVPRE